MRTLIVLIAVLAIPSLGFSATILVPGNYPTIQQAIDAASNGDTVLVDPGTYVENIDFKGKAITVTSSGGPDVTEINGGSKGSVAKFRNGEGNDSVLDGFTVTNGTGTTGPFIYWGGGIYCQNTSPTISNNIIHDNHASLLGTGGMGGGIFCSSGSPIIKDNVIRDNWCDDRGGGIYCSGCGSTTLITRNEICNNATIDGSGIYYSGSGEISYNNIHHQTTDLYGSGAGIYCLGANLKVCGNVITHNVAEEDGGGVHVGTVVVLANNTIVKNKADSGEGDGIYCCGSPVIVNCIIRDNGDSEINTGANPTVTYSNVKGGWPGEGNIDADPRFEDPYVGGYHLKRLSPCINRGTNAGAPPMDRDGDPCPYMGTADMGADEFTGLHPLEANLFSLPHNTKTMSVNFNLDADTQNGGRQYLILCGLSGTVPGIPLPGGQAVLPLNWDIVTTYVVQRLHLPNWTDFLGFLDSSGRAKAVFTPDGILTGLFGFTMTFAYPLDMPFDFVSNPINLEITL